MTFRRERTGLGARLWPDRSLWLLIVGAFASGVLQVVPFPIAGPMPQWRSQICWVALVPLLFALRAETVSRPILRGAALAYLSGVVWYLGSCYWIFQTMNLYGGLSRPVAAGILVLFALYLGLYHALFGALFVLCRLRSGPQAALLLSPFAWVAVELARARITGFPWDLLGMTQVDNPLLTKLAPWTGVFGLSFVIAAVNALWLLRLQVRDRRWTRPALTAAGVALIAVYAVVALRLRPEPRPGVGERATATLLQENLEVGAAASGPQESEAHLLESFTALSEGPSSLLLTGTPETATARVVRREVLLGPGAPSSLDHSSIATGAARAGPLVERSDVVIWPESPAPFEEQQPEFRAAIANLAKTMDAPVIAGNIGGDTGSVSDREFFNSASFVDRGGSFEGRYDKMHLVPFGEYVPYKRLFFFAGSLLDEVGRFEPGAARRTFGPYGVFICYESIFGDEIRQFPQLGAAVLVNISNDGWYGDTSAPWQHLNMVRMRAIETHRWVLRATNTGVTATIDPAGRVVASAPRHVRTAIRVPFTFEHDLTFYVRHGDLFAYACTLVTAVVVLLRRKRSRSPAVI